jgi:hypothetical protein
MHKLFLLILSICFLSIIPFSYASEISDDPRNISIKANLSQSFGMTGDVFWLILHESDGVLVTTSDNGVIVIRFDFVNHDKCYDSSDTFCLRATITETKNTYFTKPGDESTIILEFPDKLTFSFLSGELVTNTFDLDIQKTILLDEEISEKSISNNSDSNVPLVSWSDGNSRQEILEFVKKVTMSSSPEFVPIEDRIAVFDNDGTLWIEQPLYIPLGFHLEYLYDKIDEQPSLSSQSPYSEILAKKDVLSNEDLDNIPNLSEMLLIAYPEITQGEYLTKSQEYLDDTKHPRFDVPLKELTYLPMVELVHYLQANDFEVYIVSAGFQGMMQAVSEEIYNIEQENVIGTHPEFVSKLTEDGTVLIRQPLLASFNDGAEKPVNIEKIIGKKPIFACGNSGGDIEMLMLTSFHENSFGCMVNHDDELREYDYPNSEALDTSEENNWLVISMKNDFKTIFE